MLRSQCVCQFSSALYDVYMNKLPKRKKERQRWTDGQATPQREVTLALQNFVCFGGMSSTGMLTHLLHSCCRVSRDLCLSVQETSTHRLNKWGKQVNTGQPVAKCHVQVYLEVFRFKPFTGIPLPVSPLSPSHWTVSVCTNTPSIQPLSLNRGPGSHISYTSFTPLVVKCGHE